MSKSSPKARYEAFTEWHEWAKSNSSAFRTKKKKTQAPKFVSYGKNGN